jgi:ribonuclease VapC
MNSLLNGGQRLSVSSFVLDASALLAYILDEPGIDIVEDALAGGAVISSVNLAEVASRLVDQGYDDGQIQRYVSVVNLDTAPLEHQTALRAGLLRRQTRQAGLSIGDRACIALAQSLGLPAVTADRLWLNLDLGIRIELCR